MLHQNVCEEQMEEAFIVARQLVEALADKVRPSTMLCLLAEWLPAEKAEASEALEAVAEHIGDWFKGESIPVIIQPK